MEDFDQNQTPTEANNTNGALWRKNVAEEKNADSTEGAQRKLISYQHTTMRVSNS